MHKLMYIMMAVCLIYSAPVISADDPVKAVIKEGVRGAFNEAERQLIKKYFGDNPYVHYDDEHSHKHKDQKNKDHGKSKNKDKGLPPGIAKNLERGKPLPPGIAKRNLPHDLKRALPDIHDGYESVIVGNDVVLVEIDTGKIADIITDAVLGH